MRKPWRTDKSKEIGLQKVRVLDIVEYPKGLGSGINRCIQLKKANESGQYIPGCKESKKSIQQVLEESSNSQDCIKECLKSYCGGLYEILVGRRKMSPIDFNIALAEYKGKYYPHGSGHHRICIAKRTRVELIEAEVIMYWD